MTRFKKIKLHLKTISTHRKYVRKMCFKMGIPFQGLVHDLSKYSPAEFGIYKYYEDGSRSPHAACRELTGASLRWAKHYHRNKHHWEYYLDIVDSPDRVFAAKMPYKYVIEMFCDRVAASKTYLKDNWTCHSTWEYWVKICEGKNLMHESTYYLIKKLLWKLSELGEKRFFDWYKVAKVYSKVHYNFDSIDY